jgi:hypothetical protein
VASDEVCGGNPHLRTELEKRQIGYVLAVARDHQITTRAGKLRADALAKKLLNGKRDTFAAAQVPSSPRTGCSAGRFCAPPESAQQWLRLRSASAPR